MLNHTYTSVKNANLVDCGKKQHIPSQPTPLLKENFLGEFRTELDKKKVLAALGIATELSLEWGNIGGEVGDSDKLMAELDARTKYTSALDGMSKTIGDGIRYLESIVGGEEEGEAEQDRRISEVEKELKTLQGKVTEVQTYLTDTVDVNIEKLQKGLESINTSIENITSLIKVSNKDGNALTLLTEEDDADHPGLYVPDLSEEVSKIAGLSNKIEGIATSLEGYVTKSDLGTGPYKFVSESAFNTYTSTTNTTLAGIDSELKKTIKKGSDGNVNTLGVNKITNSSNNIEIDRSLERTTNAPLDIYCVRNSLQELYALDPEVCYSGMGVIVTSDNPALYILRDPKGQEINSEYIQDPDNWKCPEDLVIELITKDKYDKKVQEGSIDQHLFYYIYEEVIEEPNPKDYQGGSESNEYKEALDRWLKHLQGQYMSAVWGQEIEKLVASKASNSAIKSLEDNIQKVTTLIGSLAGGSEGINLKDLNDQILENKTNIESIVGEEGILPKVQKEIQDLASSVSSTYVTKTEITTDDPDAEYIFVKKSAFDLYEDALAQQMTTQNLNAITASVQSIAIGDNTLTSTDVGDLKLNNSSVAIVDQIPKITPCDQNYYDSLEHKDTDTYYMIYDAEVDNYLLNSDFENYKQTQSQALSGLSDIIQSNKSAIGNLEYLTTENKATLVLAINELVNKINSLSQELAEFKEGRSN